jgi:hypothetical protein
MGLRHGEKRFHHDEIASRHAQMPGELAPGRLTTSENTALQTGIDLPTGVTFAA